MKSLTKNIQSAESIQKMVEQFFKGHRVTACMELTEGYFNAAYLAELEDGRELVLKVAPKADIRIMTYEKNIMVSEVRAMEMAAAYGNIPLPKLWGYDDSGKICKSPKMLKAGLQDAEKGNVILGVLPEDLLQYLEYDKECFEKVTVPKLVHWDLWDGNVFVKNGEITGLIDWERSIWGDPFLEVGFRTYSQNKDFLRGYGITELTPDQGRRALWYDIYLLLLVSLECEYRGYETSDMYEWASKLMRQQFDRIRQNRLRS